MALDQVTDHSLGQTKPPGQGEVRSPGRRAGWNPGTTLTDRLANSSQVTPNERS